MPTSDPTPAALTQGSFVVGNALGSAAKPSGFIDRRREDNSGGASERRQFGSSHEGLTPEGRELALAIDQYKLQHHRRYITCDEMMLVIRSLGYSK
ncbi:MAG: hypothetical protein AAFU85_06745 [Planctomycetota bacterium]